MLACVVSTPVWAETCVECKRGCRSERNEDWNYCQTTYPNLADPARETRFDSAAEAYTLCLGNECYAPQKPCAQPKDPVQAYGIPVFDPTNPNVPTAYEYLFVAAEAGTYYISTANIGASAPLARLAVRVNGLTIFDDPQYGTKSDTSHAVTFNAGQNRIVVSSTGTGNAAIFIGQVDLSD